MIEEDYYPEDEEEAYDETEFYAVRPNKTQIKKQIASIFAMAEEISELAPVYIAEFDLPEAVERALLDAGKMGKNAARKRLLKYITAQLRLLDIEAVQEKLARIKNQSAHSVREHHQAERWRDLLLSDSANQQLTALMIEYPDADSQYLRQLQRNAQKEAKEAKPPKSARLLYRYLKELMAAQTLVNLSEHEVAEDDDDFDDEP